MKISELSKMPSVESAIVMPENQMFLIEIQAGNGDLWEAEFPAGASHFRLARPGVIEIDGREVEMRRKPKP